MNDKKSKNENAPTLDTLNVALERFPKNARLWQKRALRHEEQGNIEQAVADLQKAIAVDPTFANAYLSLGILYGKADQLIIDPKN